MKKNENELTREVIEVLPVAAHVMIYTAEVMKPRKWEPAQSENEVKDQEQARPAKSYPLL